MLDAFQLVTSAAVPLKLTVPWAAPKFVPVIVTAVPVGPLFGDMLLTAGITAYVNPLLRLPL
jgi:hypothetical protein